MRVPVDWLREYVDGARRTPPASDIAAVLVARRPRGGGRCTPATSPARSSSAACSTARPRAAEERQDDQLVPVDVGGRQRHRRAPGHRLRRPQLRRGDLVVVVLPGGASLPGAVHDQRPQDLRPRLRRHDLLRARARPRRRPRRHHRADQDVRGRRGHARAPRARRRRHPAARARPTRSSRSTSRPTAATASRCAASPASTAHATGAAFTDPALALTAVGPAATDGGFAVELADDGPIRGGAGCDRYVARVVRGIDVAAPTPRWMQRASPRPGCARSRCAVDVTNYVMLGLGQPLHAFDLATLERPDRRAPCAAGRDG